MEELWYPKAERDPGRAAGYTRGRTRMFSVKCHYTAGYNSWGLIRDQGLAQWLVTRDGRVIQFCEADALCWDSGEWNDDGPGIEIEYRDEPEGMFTDAARQATSELIHWLNVEWGLPLNYYDGPRIPEGSHNGFIAHRAIIQSQPHGDFWPQEDWDLMVSGNAENAPEENPEEETDVRPFLIEAHNGMWLYDPNTHTAKPFATPETLTTWRKIYVVTFGNDPVVKTDPEYVALLEDAIR